MQDSEEGHNDEELPSSPTVIQQASPAPQSPFTEMENSIQAHIKEQTPSLVLEKKGEEMDDEPQQQPLSSQKPQNLFEAESAGNDASLLQLHSASPEEESYESAVCDTDCPSSLANPELEAEGDCEENPQGGVYPCQHCERRFSSKQGLERHTHIHTASNHLTHTFKCRYCTKPFGSQVGRRRHERRHENGSKTLNRPGSLTVTAFLRSPTPKDSVSPGSMSSPNHVVSTSTQNGPAPHVSDHVKREPASEPENGESKELHPCKYCNKAFGTHTNMRRHQRRIHERHLMPKGVHRKGMLLQDGSSQQQHEQPVSLQQESPSASPPPIYVPSEETEDEGEREECIVDISNNISENLSHFIDGKILSTSSVSNCDVIEVDSSTAALFGLDALILNPKQISQALKVEPQTCPLKVSCPGSSSSKRRTATPPLLPTVKMETEMSSSSSSLSSPSSQSPLLVGNLFSSSTDTFAFQKEKNYLSPKLKQLLQATDGQKSAVGLIADAHKITTPLSVSSLPVVPGRFKRRTASPPTNVEGSLSPKNDSVNSVNRVSCSLKVPKIESHSVTPTWSSSSKDHDATSQKEKDQSSQASGGNSCNQQPLDLSSSLTKKESIVVMGEAVLDLSFSRKSTSDHDVKTISAIPPPPHIKRKKPNTSILEKVLMNEYAGLNSAGEEGSNALGSPDTLSSSESATCVAPPSPGSSSERLPCESTSPPSLTPVTINPSSPSSSSVASSTPPPPVLPTMPSPPLSSQRFQISDTPSPSSYPVLSPKLSPGSVDQSLEEELKRPSTESCHDTNLSGGESDQAVEHLNPEISPLPQEAHSQSKAESSSKSGTLLEGSTKFLKNADQAGFSDLEQGATCKSSHSHSCGETSPQDLNIKNAGKNKSKSSDFKGQSISTTESPSANFMNELIPSQNSLENKNSTVENIETKEESGGVSTEPDLVSPKSTARCSDQVEFQDRGAFIKSFVCNVCKEPFGSIKNLSGHIIEHASEWPYKCEFCVQVFHDSALLLEHRSSLHGVGRIYVCSICSKEFAFFCNLQQHQSDLHPSQTCTHTVVENGKLRPQNYTNPTYVKFENNSSDTDVDSTAGTLAQEFSEEQSVKDTNCAEGQDGGCEDSTEELYTTIKIMASEAGKPKAPDVRLGINQHYPSFKPPPFPYHNRSPDGSIASATNFTTHNIPQTFNTAIRCTKCGNSFDNMPELHKHILVCANASDKKRYTPKKNPIPLKQIVKQSPNGLVSTTASASGENAFRRMGQPKRLNFNQDISSKPKLTALNKKKNQLVQKAISQKNKSATSAKKPIAHVKEETTHDVNACPYCGREFTYRASLTKHMACSCPQRPVAKKLKKEALTPPDKNRTLRSRATDPEVKQEAGSGSGQKHLGKTRSQSSEPTDGDGKAKASLARKRAASQEDTAGPMIKKGKKNKDPQILTPALSDDTPAPPQVKVPRASKDPVKKEAVVKPQTKKDERFSVRTRERVGGPVTRSLQASSSSSAPMEVKSEPVSSLEKGDEDPPC